MKALKSAIQLIRLTAEGRALMKAKVGDEVTVRTENSKDTFEVLKIDYIVEKTS